MNQKARKAVSLLLALMMLFPLLPVAGFAEDESVALEAAWDEAAEIILDETNDAETEEADAEEASEEKQPILPEEAEQPPAEADIPLEEEPFVEPEEAQPPLEAPVTELESLIATNGHAYALTANACTIYHTAAMDEPLYTLEADCVLLATIYEGNCVKVWFILSSDVVSGCVDASSLTLLSDEEASALAETALTAVVSTNAGEYIAFVAEVDYPYEDDLLFADEIQDAGQAPEPSQEAVESGLDESTGSQISDSVEEISHASAGDFVTVTTQTRAFESVDDSASDDFDGDWCLGYFVNDAIVQMESIEQDSLGRDWYRVRYLYGDDFADGTLKWTEYGTVFILASETGMASESGFTVTDFAFRTRPASRALRLAASPMNGFSLKSINAAVPSLYVGQSGVYGSSGKDSDYLQIAKSPDHGTVYATPHYLDGFTVYCLEHTLPGPGENISGGGQQPAGPYVIVDVDSYRNTPGYSSIIYHESTLHAIAWVLRHTYPFMVLDRSDADNEVWSRVAGQFAIRQVIRELEGAQYVRSYWNMDNFYRASGQAPAVYLEYARWLATNGIARASMTGNITFSNKSVAMNGNVLTGTATLSTDADLMRISRSVGSLMGNTAGQDSSYYYLNSGDTISVSTTGNSLTLVAESVSSEDEEANFLVGVPSAAIQKVLIPQYGTPYKLQSETIAFDVPNGSVTVTKIDAGTGAKLAGANFDLILDGTVLRTLPTGADGVVTFDDVPPGNYVIRERTAPEGYVLGSVNIQNVTVSNGTVSAVTFADERSRSRIRIVKTDALTGEPLSGAVFTLTRLSAPAAANGAGVGGSFTVTTNANGAAETGWLEWGRYRIEETGVPNGYVNNHYAAEIEAYENGKTYVIEVSNEPTKGYIRLTKTDRRNGNPIEGVRFDIYFNDEYGQGLAATMVTDKNGVALSEPLRKGTYVVREHGETAGYVFEEVALNAVVKSDETTELQATNLPVAVRLKLYKRDAEEYDGDLTAAPSTRGDGVLTGAEFQVLAAENIMDRQGNVVHAKGSVVIASLKTSGEDASVTTEELWPGKYEVVELTPPTGYLRNEKSIVIDARAAAKQSQEAVVTYEGAISDKILYGAFGIVKFLGDNQVHEDAGVVEKPEKGAEFEVYLKSAGSYEEARAFERDYLVTNRYGKATTKPLPYGVYVLRQVAGQEGHAVMRPIEVMIDGTEDIQDPPALILNNQVIRYRLKLVKVDAETGKPVALAGTAFKLKDANGEYVKQAIRYPQPMELDTFVTNEDGEVTLPETVAWGQYFIEEVQSPEGYLLQTEDVPVFVGRIGDAPDEVYEVVAEVPNVPVKGNISLEKRGLQLTGFETVTDTYGNEVHRPVYEEGYLAGAEFELRAAEPVVGKDGTVWYEQGELIETLTTNGDGPVISRELPLGRYVLTEIAAPAGYALASEPYEVELAFADSETVKVEAVVEATNAYLAAEIMLEKEAEATQVVEHEDGTITQQIVNIPGEGFVFGLFSAKNILTGDVELLEDTLVATDSTDEHGRLTFSGCFPHGDYYLQELSAPKGWRVNPNRFAIVLDPAKKALDADILRVSLPEAVHNELVYTPITLTKTDITGENTVPGALIEVWNSRGDRIYLAYTDENGQIPDIPVTPGQYAFREILAPEGYALNEAILTFFVDASGNVTGDTVIRDDFTRIPLLKQDTDGNPLAGVEFALLTEDGAQLMTAVSDETGLAAFERIPYGNYTVVETKPLPGFALNPMEIRLSVDGEYVNPTEPVIFVNVPDHYSFQKVDNEGKPLAGVKFALEDEAGNTLCELVSDRDGMVHAIGLGYGRYLIRETEALEGYIRSEETVELVIDENYAVPEETPRWVNYPGIQTGVDFTVTPVMWAGAATVLAAGALAVKAGLLRRKRKKKKARRGHSGR